MGCGEVRGDVGKGEGREMWGIKSVLGPHTSTHFPTSSPLPSPHPFPTANTLPHSPHTLSHTLPTHLSLSPPTAPLTSPYTPTHFFIHPMHSPTPLSPHFTPQFRLCGEVTELLEKPNKIFYGNREFKVLFRCMQC